jgi:geranylgeranyl diphosphate synthase, type II
VSFEVQLSQYAKLVDNRLKHLLPSPKETPCELHEAMQYSCLSPGKRLRPALVLVSCAAFSTDEKIALDAACAVEMIHSFSLIHDDLPALDNDDLRRGNPTCHVKFGEAVAILAGDALFALGFEAIANMNLPAERVVKLMKILTRSVGTYGLVGGETLDILSENQTVSTVTLETIHLRKTASLIAASCEMGAVCAGANSEDQERLRLFGEKIGLAFQIADDVLNETSTAEVLGKAVGSDRELGKATYPTLFGLEPSKRKALELAFEASNLLTHLPNHALLDEIAKYAVNRLK